MAQQLPASQKLAALNGPQSRYAGLDYFRFLDGAEEYRLEIAYVHPVYQAAQVRAAKFEILSRIASENGASLSEAELRTTDTPWIYFVCRKL